jgi:Na+/melibiose symporter-like transporter
LFLAISIFVFNVCNFISIASIKKDLAIEKKQDIIPPSEIIKGTLGNKNFRSVVVLTILWDVARYFTVGFLGVFKNNDLMMSALLVQIINVSANFLRLLVSKPMGRYSDKHSFSKGFDLGLVFAAIACFANIFTTKSTWFFIIIYTVFYNCSLSGTYANSFNMVYNYVDSKYIVHAMAIKNCIGGVLGFLASIVGGNLLSFIQSNGNTLFGIHMYGQQALSAISFVIIVVAILFVKFVIAEQKRIIQ